MRSSAGRDLAPVREQLERIHAGIRDPNGCSSPCTCMPVTATCIPTFRSTLNNYDMLHEADRVVDRIMALADSLDGVISGEHGIGLTKIQYLDEQKLEAFVEYKKTGGSGGVLQSRQVDAGCRTGAVPIPRPCAWCSRRR